MRQLLEVGLIIKMSTYFNRTELGILVRGMGLGFDCFTTRIDNFGPMSLYFYASY